MYLHTHTPQEPPAGVALDLEWETVWELKTGRIVGAEVSPVWDEPGGHSLRGDLLHRVLARRGFVSQLPCVALHRLGESLPEWRGEAGVELGFVSFDVTPSTLRDEGFLYVLEALFESDALGSTRLVAELDASECARDSSLPLDRLMGMGLSLALDDFGRGASLGLLGWPLVHSVKLDPGVIHDFDKRWIETVLRQGHHRGQQVVALGVDDPRQVEFLKNLGCRWGQGSLFSRPVSENRLLWQLCDTQMPNNNGAAGAPDRVRGAVAETDSL